MVSSVFDRGAGGAGVGISISPDDGVFLVGDGNTWVAESGATARASLGLVVGTDVQAWDDDLDDLAGLAHTDGNLIVSDGTDWVVETGATLRTSIGVGTGDSPQFTGVELGHATDTTLTRVSAGDVNIEGNIVYRAGGTDIPVTDGGTGASTAASARTNLDVTSTTDLADTSDVAKGDALIGVKQGSETATDLHTWIERERIQLTANRSYFIATTGSDTNDGLSAGAPFATFAKVVTVLKGLDFHGFVVTVNIADGTYTTGLDLKGPMVGQVNDDDLVFSGNTTTPANVFIQWAAASGALNISEGARCKLEGIKVGNNENYGLKVSTGAVAHIGNMDFAANATGHIQTADGRVLVTANYEITGNAPNHIVAEVGRGLFDFGTNTITLTGTPDFSTSFLNVGEGSHVAIHNVTFSGSGTGKRYDIKDAGSVVPLASIDSLPGNAVGTLDPSPLTSGTSIAPSTSSHDFTGIPAWVERITLTFEAISLSGGDNILIQIGDAGGVETTGYVSTSVAVDNVGGSSGSSSTAGYIIDGNLATDLHSGHMVLTKVTGNRWMSSHVLKRTTAQVCIGGGDKTLSATLDRVRLTVSGANTYDGGNFNILYE